MTTRIDKLLLNTGDSYASFEGLVGSGRNTLLVVIAAAYRLLGGAGNNRLDGGSGNAGELKFLNGVLSGDTNGDRIADCQAEV